MFESSCKVFFHQMNKWMTYIGRSGPIYSFLDNTGDEFNYSIDELNDLGALILIKNDIVLARIGADYSIVKGRVLYSVYDPGSNLVHIAYDKPVNGSFTGTHLRSYVYLRSSANNITEEDYIVLEM